MWMKIDYSSLKNQYLMELLIYLVVYIIKMNELYLYEIISYLNI